MVRLKSRYLLFEVLNPEELQFLQQQQEKGAQLHILEFKSNDLINDSKKYSRVSKANRETHFENYVTSALQLRQPGVVSDSRQLLKLVKESVETNFGIKGSGEIKSTIAVKYFSPRTSTGIIRVARDHVSTVWAALSYITKINNKNVIIRVVRVSGTIKKCEQAAIRRDKKVIEMIGRSYIDGFKNTATNEAGIGDGDPVDSEDDDYIEDDNL